MQPINRQRIYENALVYHGYPRDISRVVASDYASEITSSRGIRRKHGVWNKTMKSWEYHSITDIQKMVLICHAYKKEMHGIRYVY